MAIVTTEQLQAQLNITLPDDDSLLQDKLTAAQGHIERLLGYRIEEQFGGEDQEPVPEPLCEAVLQLAAWWYEQREAAITGTIVAPSPHSVADIVQEYREWSF
ncbi:head-tail connector protein [Alkalilacustris brevis]|uniref:head-tail connector protein n=1 Tax=Alkalilacustris brevis TaxID=2026338 RepID=UPI000E0D69FE|nr:head-tail connector protein [Alkalilacustris brevis]